MATMTGIRVEKDLAAPNGAPVGDEATALVVPKEWGGRKLVLLTHLRADPAQAFSGQFRVWGRKKMIFENLADAEGGNNAVPWLWFPIYTTPVISGTMPVEEPSAFGLDAISMAFNELYVQLVSLSGTGALADAVLCEARAQD